MKKTLFGIPIIYLLICVVGVVASISIIGSVVANMVMPRTILVGQRKVNEEVTYTLAMINETITSSFNITSQCLGCDSVSIKLTKPIGSNPSTPITLGLNNVTNIINAPGQILEVGNITITIRNLAQGKYNVTLFPEVEANVTLLTWEDSL